jgi:hypothetical protein
MLDMTNRARHKSSNTNYIAGLMATVERKTPFFTPEQMCDIPALDQLLDVKVPATTMIFGYDKRIVMGPGRNGALYGVVALVPDKDLHEDSKAILGHRRGPWRIFWRASENFQSRCGRF